MEEKYHATTQNRFCPDISNVNKNITVEAKLISPPMYEPPSKLKSVITRHRFRNNLITSPYQYVGFLTLWPLKIGPIRCLGESGKDYH